MFVQVFNRYNNNDDNDDDDDDDDNNNNNNNWMEKTREELKEKITGVKEFEITENELISEIKKKKTG